METTTRVFEREVMTPQAQIESPWQDRSHAWSAALGAMAGAGTVLLIAVIVLLWRKPKRRELPLLAPMDIRQNMPISSYCLCYDGTNYKKESHSIRSRINLPLWRKFNKVPLAITAAISLNGANQAIDVALIGRPQALFYTFTATTLIYDLAPDISATKVYMNSLMHRTLFRAGDLYGDRRLFLSGDLRIYRLQRMLGIVLTRKATRANSTFAE
ncbi:hypothetical protein K1T71_004915 [Dendrolimus kikuchii]|uniref:Uncharacterized protein n=1 Tax=Dendrolimus kikuchii TaxID=765133 RepID=A0ACC1D6I7_9NEOP|nr:hypothetical protein K1T71_004915 [Dendrolimus kikuchii]